MKTMILSPKTAVIVLIFCMMACSSCDKDPETGEGPIRIEQIIVDNVGNNTAWFMVDYLSRLTDVSLAGFCWSKTNPPTRSDHDVSFDPIPGINYITADGLEANTEYFMSAWYIHNGRTWYSNPVSFKTTSPLSDNDGNEYNVIKIGDQLWMGENLRVLTYNNGDSVGNGTGRGNYAAMQTPRFYFHYNDDKANTAIYGNLYTWHAATDNRGLCPASWRLPDVADWEKMIRHLDILSENYNPTVGGNQELSAVAGGMMRGTGTVEQGTGLWNAPNTGATNISGLNFLPSGYRDPSGLFDGLGVNAALWSFTEKDPSNALMLYSHYFNPGIHVNTFSKSSGYAVRCIKDVN